MIQLNLLPDVKLEYIKTQRQRRLVVSVSGIVTIVSIALLVAFLVVGLAQRKHLSDLSRDISSEAHSLQQQPDITKVLTVQNQLESLSSLHADKPAASRLFDNYLNEITPGNVSISSFHIDFTQDTATITGTADSLSSVNKYVDTLKFTTYTSSNNSSASSAFSNVVLSSFGLNGSTSSAQAATYTISLSYDKNIFDITEMVKLSIPNLVTTRSELAQPDDLFKAAPATNTSGGTQ